MHKLIWSIVTAVLISTAASAQGGGLQVCENWDRKIGVVADMFPVIMAGKIGESALDQVDGLAMSVLYAMFPRLQGNRYVRIVAFADLGSLEKALIAGEVDIGIGLYYDSLIEPYVKYLQPGFFNNLIGALYLGADKKYEKPADFKGLRGVYADNSDMAYQALASKHQLSINPVKSDSEALAMLETRRADFYLMDTYRARRLLRDPRWRAAGLGLASTLGSHHMFFAISQKSGCIGNNNLEMRYQETIPDFDAIISQAASKMTW